MGTYNPITTLLAEVVDERHGPIGYAHWCPGCEEVHVYYTKAPGAPIWSFNGNTEKPSFTASMLITTGKRDDPNKTICHYYLTDGQLKFLADSTHALAGQTVDLPPLPDWMKA